MKTLVLATAALSLIAAPCWAGTKPLIRSSEETASALCKAFERPLPDLLVLCEVALEEFHHTDLEIATYQVNLARALDEHGRHKEAQQMFLKALDRAPALERGWRHLGWSYWDSRQLEAAESAFRKALDVKVTAEALAGLGSTLRKVSPRDPEALKLLEGSLLVSPGYNWARVELGWLHYNLGDYESAETRFANALARDKAYHHAAFGLSRSLFRLKRYDPALVAINTALESQQKNAVYVAHRASILRFANRPRQALDTAMEAMALDPGLADAYVEAAWALFDLGRAAEALDIMETGGDQGLSSAFFHYNHADLLTRENRWQKGLAAIDRALDSPDSNAADHNMRAWILLVLERYPEAENAARNVLDRAEGDLKGLFYLAYAEAGQGAINEALKTFRTALLLGQDQRDTDDFIAFLIKGGYWAAAAKARLAANDATQNKENN